MPLRFSAKLEAAGGGGHFVALKPSQVKALEGKAHTRVKGTVEGVPFRSSIFPYGGVFYLMVHKATVEAAGTAPGKRIALVVERDEAPRTFDMPPELAKALARNPKAQAFFGQLAFTHRKEYAAWVRQAKRPRTRARRIAETVRLCAAGVKWQDKPKEPKDAPKDKAKDKAKDKRKE